MRMVGWKRLTCRRKLDRTERGTSSRAQKQRSNFYLSGKATYQDLESPVMYILGFVSRARFRNSGSVRALIHACALSHIASGRPDTKLNLAIGTRRATRIFC